jgi:hypothetical protein
MTTNSIKNVIHSAMKNLFRKEFALLLLVILAYATAALAQDGAPTQQPPITPVPLISQISPVSVAPGGPDFTLTVTGANFTFDCVVQWNGTALATTLVNTNKLTAVVPAALTASGGTGQITVLATDAIPLVLPASSGRSPSISLPPTVVSNRVYLPVGLPFTTLTDVKDARSTGALPNSLGAADFDNNGKLDLAVVNQTDGTVSILMGQGDGNFQPPTHPLLTVAASPFGIATGDLNGDGKIDLVIGNASTNGLSIALGDGTGDFTVTNLPGGSCPEYPVLADVNEDGFLDIVVGNECGNGILVYLGNGDGTFQTPATINSAGVTDVYQLVVADFDGDGNPDIAAATSEGSLLYFFKGTGSATFAAPVTYTAVAGAWAIASGDFDGNGTLDLAVSSINNNGIVILPGNGDGTFAEPNVVTATGTYNAMVAGDLNIDGKLDLVTLSSSGFVHFWAGNGNGNVGAPLTIGKTEANYGLALGNFLTAGSLDVAVTYSQGENILVPTISITPPNASFGSVNVGSTPQIVLTVTNTTVNTVTFSGNSISGTNAALFTQTNTCGTSELPPAGTCTFTITYTPVAAGSFNAALAITDDAQGLTQFAGLFGSGVGIPLAGLSVNSIAFGNENIGSTSSSMPVTLTNTGTGALTGLALSVTGTNSLDFSQSSNCEDTLAVSASCIVNVTFTPSVVGGETASLRIADNASNSPQSVALTGTGVQVATQLLYIQGPPAQLMAGSSIGTVTLGVYDAHSVLIASAITNIRVTITGPNLFHQGTSAIAVSGVATFDFSAVPLDAAGLYTITAAVNLTVQPRSRGVIPAGASGGIAPAVANTLVVAQNSSIQLNVAGYPSPTFTGFAHTFTVSATDAFSNPITTYTGTVTLSSSDVAAVLTPSPYTFVSGDMGAHTFTGTLNTVGTQSVSATDSQHELSGSQTGIVVNAAPHFVVNTLADDSGTALCDGDEACSFRSAITLSNTAGEGLITVDTSQFQGSAPFTATLTNGVLELTGNISITGPPGNPEMTISANGASAIFLVDSGAVVTISAFNLIEGGSRSDGGAISNAGTLTLANSQVINSQTQTNGGGIANTGTLTITGSEVAENLSNVSGGGIVSSGTLTITNSTVDGNFGAVNGGGILSSGTLTVNASTIEDNSSGANGAGASTTGTAVFYDSTINGNSASGNGGAIYNNGSLSIPQSTLYDNTAVDGSAIENNGSGTMVLLQCTVTQNSATGGTGGTIRNLNDDNGAVTLLNTIDAGNSSLAGDCPGCGTQSNFNAINVSAENLGLGGLADNGGPTQTVMAFTGSVVLGAGSVPLIAGANLPQSLVNDQRGAGFVRVINNTVDLGSVQMQPVLPTALLLTVNDSSVAGQPLTVTVSAVAECDDPVTSFTDTVHFTSSDPLAVLPADYTFIGGDDGVHAFSVTLKTSGTQTLTVTDVQHPSLTATQTIADAAAAASTIIAVAGSGQTATPGSAFAIALAAKVTDAFGNLIPAIPVTFTAPTTGASGTFAGGVSTVTIATLSTGIATAPAFTANSTAGQYTVTAGASANPGVTGKSSIHPAETSLTPASFTLTNGVPPSYTVTANPATLSIVQGQSGTTALTFTPVGGFTGTVSLTCSGLPADADCVFVPAQAVMSGNNQVVTVTLTVNTTGNNGQLSQLWPSTHRGPGAGGSNTKLPVLFGMFLSIAILGWSSTRARRPRYALAVLALLIVLTGAGLTACTHTHATSTTATVPGTYPVDVTASVGSGGTQTAVVMITIVKE